MSDPADDGLSYNNHDEAAPPLAGDASVHARTDTDESLASSLDNLPPPPAATALTGNPVDFRDVWGEPAYAGRADFEHDFSALDANHWTAVTFSDLDDSAYGPMGEGKILWQPDSDAGKSIDTMDAPRSDTVEIAGHSWRLKLDPHGAAIGYLSVYLECLSISTATPPDDVELPIPLLYGETLQPFARLPVQFSVVLYDRHHPTKCHWKVATHAFTKSSQDRGFPRFLRLSHWTPNLDKDLNFIAYIRVYNDPTGCLFDEDHVGTAPLSMADTFGKNGVCPIRDEQILNGPIAAAVVAWLFLAPFREVIYGVSDLSQRPLVSTFQELLYLIRTPKWPTPRRLDRLILAARRYGCTLRDAKDVYQVWRMLVKILDFELANTPQSHALRCLFRHPAFRVKVEKPPTKNIKSVKDGIARVALKEPLPCHPILQVELPRQYYNEQAREWQYFNGPMSIDEELSLACSSSQIIQRYRLYGLILHEGGLRSAQFSIILRPGGHSWYRFHMGEAQRQTWKQATQKTQNTVYIAMYMREDFALRALPDLAWTPPEWLSQMFKTPLSNGVDHVLADCHVDVATNGAHTEADHDEDDNDDDNDDDDDDDNDHDHDINEADDDSEESYEPPDIVMPAAASAPANTTPSNGTGHAIQDGSIHDRDQLQTTIRGDVEMSEAITAEHVFADAKWSYCEYSEEEEKNVIVEDYLNCEYHKGSIQDGKYSGYGVHIYWNGDRYSGDFGQGLANGSGLMVFANGDNYNGEWKAGKMDGRGTLVSFSTNNKYAGGFKDGRRHGAGVTTWQAAEAGEDLCMICYVKEQSCAFYNCGHVCACLECAEQVERCPICRKRVIHALKLYFTSKTT